MEENWENIKRCPVCGGKVVISYFYSFSVDYTITKRGVLSKKGVRSIESPMDCVTVTCMDCEAEWCSDQVKIDAGKLWLKLEQ